MLRIVESDEQIRAHTHELPEEIHLEDVRSHNQAKHGHGEEAQESIETLESFLITYSLVVLVALSHIAKAIDMNHERDCGDNDEHHHRDRRQTETDVERQQVSELQPSEVEHGHGRIKSRGSVSAHCKEIFVSRVETHAPQYAKHCSSYESSHGLLHLHTEQSQDQEAQEREKKYQK